MDYVTGVDVSGGLCDVEEDPHHFRLSHPSLLLDETLNSLGQVSVRAVLHQQEVFVIIVLELPSVFMEELVPI